MTQNVDLNQLQQSTLQQGKPVNDDKSNQLKSELTANLDQLFDLIFKSSQQVLGNITSIGIRYGDKKDAPENLLVVFPNDVYGFESWSNQKKCRWRYQRDLKLISQNGKTMPFKQCKPFIEFVNATLGAMENQNVIFSKNITQDELKAVA